MARKNDASQKDAWFKLLTNVIADAAKLPDLSVHTSVLAAVLDEARERGARLQANEGFKRKETKDHRELMRKGEEAAGKLRSALRGHYGFRSPELAKYGVKPLEPGRRAPKPKTPPPEEPKPENPAQAPPAVQPAPQGAGPSKSPQTS